LAYDLNVIKTISFFDFIWQVTKPIQRSKYFHPGWTYNLPIGVILFKR